MRGVSSLSDSYFDKYKDKKVKIKPFDPRTKLVAKKYIEKLREILGNLGVEIVHKGSTAMGIAGKGEIEVGIYPKVGDWEEVVQRLTNHYEKIGNQEEDYVRFNDIYDGIEIEIILMKGVSAEIDKKLFEYLISNPQILKEYEEIKYKYCYSKKDYMIQKDKFFRKIINMILGE